MLAAIKLEQPSPTDIAPAPAVASAGRLLKSADGTFPARLLGKFMPLGERRELEPEERQALERAGRQWIRPVIETDSTPITDLVT